MPNYALEGPKWTTKTITWSFADPGLPGGSVFSNAIGAAYQSVIRSAVARWDDVTNLSFVQVADGTPGVDIRIGWSQFGTGGQIGETDYSYSAVAGVLTFVPGITVRLEDPAQIPLSPAPAAVYSGYVTNLYQVALHELGHALGLDHASDPAAVMYASAGSGNRDLNQTDLDGIHTLYAAPAFAQTEVATGVSSHPDGTAYTGPVASLQQQYIYGGTAGVAISATVANVFIHGGPGDDAIAALSGQNVLDGGTGSNFLVGGSGTDTFFLDARGGGTTWDTLVNFHAGDAATLWGFTAGVSSYRWDGVSGAAGYTGATLRADLGTGTAASLTFAGLSMADAAGLAVTTGSSGGSPYLSIVRTG